MNPFSFVSLSFNKFCLSFILIFFISVTTIKSQFSCGFDEIRKENLTNPSFVESQKILEEKVLKIIEQNMLRNGSLQEEKYTIPIVIHLVNHTNLETLNDDVNYYQGMLNYVNELFSGEIGKIYEKNSSVSTSAIDTKIEFIFAPVDPQGNSFSGINIVNADNITNFETDGITRENSKQVFDSFGWDINYYVNIFIASETHGLGFFDSNIDGAAFVQNIPNNPNETSNTIAHEIGHLFGLHHTFEDGDNDAIICPLNDQPTIQGDRCPDTQPHKQSFNGAYSFVDDREEFNLNECLGENFNANTAYNVMSYFPQYLLFTNDQKIRMRATLALKNYTTILFETGKSETDQPFTRLVSSDKRCELTFDNQNFLVLRNIIAGKSIAETWIAQYQIYQDDQNIRAFGENGILNILIDNNNSTHSIWQSNTPCDNNYTLTKLENRGNFFAPNCTLAVYYGEDKKEVWNNKLFKDYIMIYSNFFSLINKSIIVPGDKLVQYDMPTTNLNEFNYIISADKSRVYIYNGTHKELLGSEENGCSWRYNKFISNFKF